LRDVRTDRPNALALALLDARTCARIVADAGRLGYWEPGVTYNLGPDTNTPSSKRSCEVMHERRAPWLFREMRLALPAIVASLPPDSSGAELCVSQVDLVRYRPGGFFSEHRDAVGEMLAWRTWSVLCYLNDDFTGGLTTFADAPPYQPRTGEAIVFPSTLMHAGTPVESGEKYVFTMWLGSIEQPRPLAR
jgi:hypothetical protein